MFFVFQKTMTNKCPTCFEPLISDSKNYIVSTPCGHLFHMNCVQGWTARGNQTCPQCRSHISKDKLLRIYLQPTESDVQISQETDENQQEDSENAPQHFSSISVTYSREANSVSIDSPSNSSRTVNELSNHRTVDIQNIVDDQTENLNIVSHIETEARAKSRRKIIWKTVSFCLFISVPTLLVVWAELHVSADEKEWINERNSVSLLEI